MAPLPGSKGQEVDRGLGGGTPTMASNRLPPESSPPTTNPVCGFLRKLKGAGKTPPPRATWPEIGWAFVGAFCGIGALAGAYYLSREADTKAKALIIGSFGASAVLLYAVPSGPLSQPRNLVGGHIISAFIGVAIRVLVVELPPWKAGLGFAAALAVATSTSVMMITRTTHPPGAASALIAVLAEEGPLHDLGWLFIVYPVGAGALLMLVVALFVNNIQGNQHHYPVWWW